MDSSICVATITGLPKRRALRMMRFWMPGTRSAGNSTPRSPRATITASDNATISSRRSMAEGFSSLETMEARSPISARASDTSSGRCTKDSAIQSAPSSSARARSRRSFSVSAVMGSTTPGTFTPLRSDSLPPTITLVSAKSGPQLTTSRRSLPSSSSSSAPGTIAAKISGCGRRARWALPGASFRSRRKGCPSTSMIGPSAKTPTRSLGPCRSARMPMGRPVSCSSSRSTAKRARWSSALPWLKFRRNTSTPAMNSPRTMSLSELAGPRVATILAFLVLRMIQFSVVGASIRMARKSFTLVNVGPVITESPNASKKPCPSLLARLSSGRRPSAQARSSESGAQ